MALSDIAGIGGEGGKIRVDLYCVDDGCERVEELLIAVANSVRWKDRIDLRIQRLTGTVDAPAQYGPTGSHSVVVCGMHVIHDADYHALSRALEDCEAMGGVG